MLATDDDFDLMFPIKDNGHFNENDLNISNFLLKPLNPLPNDNSEINVVDTDYEQFVADVWVGIVLTLMVLSCVCFMCTCLIYHKFQQWKSRVINPRNDANLEANVTQSDLPSYTIASGLPSYEEALEQLKKKTSQQLPVTQQMATLSVVSLYPFVNNEEIIKNAS